MLFNGKWSGEISDGKTATVTLDEVGKWSLTINRGRESLTFYPLAVSRPGQLCFWLPADWVSVDVCEVFASVA